MTIVLCMDRGSALLCLMLVTMLPFEGSAKRGGYLNFQFLCYTNPGHLDVNGDICDSIPSKSCDPYFNICISNKPIKDQSTSSCSVYHHVTEPYNNQESVCYVNSGDDNRDNLQKNQVIELPYPLQELYYVQIVVKDSDQFNSFGDIATFSAIFRGTPSNNFNEFKNTELLMTREENKIQNINARMKISIGLKCDWNLYGSHCSTFCRSSKTDHYVCSEKGEKLCNAGWRGSNCSSKDLCSTIRCAKGAHCLYLPNIPKCVCNGNTGPECYENYKPCHPNPCKNGGECQKVGGTGISCVCKNMFQGDRCQFKYDLCKNYPCENNASCFINSNGNIACLCQPLFFGHLCQFYNAPTTTDTMNATMNDSMGIFGLRTDKSTNYGYIYGILFILAMVVISAFLTYSLLQHRKNKKKSMEKRDQIDMKNMAMTSSAACLSNDYGTYNGETLYDVIDERATYVYQVEDNDDYLVPSRPITPTITPSGRSDSSDYVKMFNNDNTYISDDVTHMNTRENEGLPPLPTRTPTKKTLHFFRNKKL